MKKSFKNSFQNSFQTLATLAPEKLHYHSLPALEEKGYPVSRLPYSLRILLENLLRREDGETVTRADIQALLEWDARAEPSREISFMPARVLLQDFTGVPAVVDLACMRDAMRAMGGDPALINPALPSELVIDHSVQVDAYGSEAALLINAEKEFERNRERYLFLKWGQQAFDSFKVVPPATGIVHQVNLEYLARVVFSAPDKNGSAWCYPDTLVGTDSHTTMVNGLGVLGWGVGGIEAEAAMLGQPVAMLIPQVVGFKLAGSLPEGATATDLVLRVTEMLRKKGVVGKFVEYYGPGLASLPIADRATLANMAPEYGATCGIFPVDAQTLDYLSLTGRSESHIRLVADYMRAQGLFHEPGTPDATYSDTLELDISTVHPSLAGPKRPQDRVEIGDVARSFGTWLENQRADRAGKQAGTKAAVPQGVATAVLQGEPVSISDGAIVIAAITSCTNTSNPSVMVAAGLVARKAAALGLKPRPWVKTSLAPGSKVVTEYLRKADLLKDLEAVGFHVVGYGCTTCIGNSGPLPEPVAAAVRDRGLITAAVLSGNRNFEGRINPLVRANYLASPPLVVAYSLAGRMDVDLSKDAIGISREGRAVHLRDIWPSRDEIARVMADSIHREMFVASYADVYAGPDEWKDLEAPSGTTYDWDDASTYIKHPPYFRDLPRRPSDPGDIRDARVLAMLGDSVTTDHISPAGSIATKSPAGAYLIERGVAPQDFNSYGSRRGNHEVMIRGTFANVRLRNQLVPGVEGGETLLLPEREPMSIYEAAMEYGSRRVPAIILAGKEYGSGSSRDWAAKGPALLGVRAVMAESFERIHRSNLLGMGILPLQYKDGETASKLGLDGFETYDITGLREALATKDRRPAVTVTARRADGKTIAFRAMVRLDTPQETEYYRHGGILPYVLRHLLER